jgi:uncharacterized protein (DUF58 family)
MRPTLLGIKAAAFYAVLLGAFFVAPYMNLFFLLLVFLTVLGSLTVLWNARSLAGVGGEIVDVEPAPAGTPAVVAVRLAGGARERAGLRVRLQLADRAPVVCEIPALRGEIVAHGRLPALPRGVHVIDAAFVETELPFGLLRARRRLPAPRAAIIAPAPARLAAAGTRQAVLVELGAAGAAAAPGDAGPSGLREFRAGDAMRDVSWKATARRGALVVRERDADAGFALEVVLDLRCDGEVLERALSTAVALADLAHEHKDPFTLRTHDHAATYGAGHLPRRGLLEYLAGAKSVGSAGPPPPPSSPAAIHLPGAFLERGVR